MKQIEVRIDEIGHAGDGVAMLEGERIYVPLALPGETVEVEVADHHARLVRIATPSPDRVKAPCRHFGACGGCALQHWRETSYRTWKQDQIRQALSHRAIEADIAPMIPASPRSRRRTALSARRTKSGVLLGYHRRAGHEIVPVNECQIVVPEIAAAFQHIARLVAPGLTRRGEASVLVTATTTGLDVNVSGGADLTLDLRQSLAERAAESDLARLVWNGEDIATRRPPVVRLAGIPVTPPPGAFLQPTEEGEAALTGEILAAVAGAGTVADLFAGCGTFTFALARNAKVHAVESAADHLDALTAAAHAASASERLKPISVERRDLFRRPLLALECNGYDAIVFDPPRSGAQAQVQELAGSKVPTLIAVSCNPATFARDARILIDGGYRLQRITPVDQFLWSAHLELVAVFTRD